MGQIVAHICPSTWEQKVDVSHSGGAQGEAAPLGSVPSKELLKQGIQWPKTSATQRTVLMLWHSGDAVSKVPLTAKTGALDSLCVFCALRGCAPLLLFFILFNSCRHLRGANEGWHPFVDVWHSILQLPIKGSWLALEKKSLLSRFGALDNGL